MLAWIVLIVSGILEAVWATALGASHGFSRPIPSAVFVVGLVLSMAGLGYAVREIPTGTAYAVWVGVGAALTVGYAMLTGAESVSPLRLALVALLVMCVVGLKLTGHEAPAAGSPASEASGAAVASEVRQPQPDAGTS
jgi:quaternary ammonium compound-resistance protein SugE